MVQRCFLLLYGFYLASNGSITAWSQEVTQDGFRSFQGRYVEILTDLPAGQPAIERELLELPKAFDAAVPIWCKFFDVPLEEVATWKAQACIMLEKSRFREAGLIPPGLPDFPYGFQFHNQLFVSEQPSAYYRRHLLIHEGTHWFMSRHFGQNAPPWIMEGMAEWFGTHRWDPATAEIAMPIIPLNKTQVPYWGRITRIQKELSEQTAPALEDIMQYDNSAHRRAEAYAWSWAAVVFMMSHPDNTAAFKEAIYEQPMDPNGSQTRWFFERLRSRWPAIREAWNAFVSELDYGWTPEAGLMSVTAKPRKLADEAEEIVVETNRSWQASGIYVLKGDRVQLKGEGSYQIAETSKPWVSTAEGVTLEYYRGQPLGKLMMSVALPRSNRIRTEPIVRLPVGAASEIIAAQAGELQFRINEASGNLSDNRGSLRVTIEKMSR